jgi:hypothetical protein
MIATYRKYVAFCPANLHWKILLSDLSVRQIVSAYVANRRWSHM